MTQIDLSTLKNQLHQGDIVKGVYILGPLIGAGSFGQIFSAKNVGGDNTPSIAIKFEHINAPQPQITNEAIVMHTMAGNPHFTKFYHHGIHKNYRFVSMELLGPSLIDVVNRKAPFHFTLHSILKIGIQITQALMNLHEAGFIHRDIKPANISIGNSQETAGNIYLIDLGLCKRFVTAEQTNYEIPQNDFRGTIRYASLRTHLGFDLGRSDDLISVLYMLIDLRTKNLPWNQLKTIDEVCKMKEKYLGKRLVNNLPKQFEQIQKYLFNLGFFDEPDYMLIIKLLYDIASDYQLDMDAPFEWEEDMDEMRQVVLNEQEEQEQSNGEIKNQNSNKSYKKKQELNMKNIQEKISSQHLIKMITLCSEEEEKMKLGNSHSPRIAQRSPQRSPQSAKSNKSQNSASSESGRNESVKQCVRSGQCKLPPSAKKLTKHIDSKNNKLVSSDNHNKANGLVKMKVKEMNKISKDKI
ncbi:MAG: putative Tau tubulin kinase 1 [Streblomastix strix]|uniref:Putative Tau tubulin kinase 1 n=1 Tax=Streblomastix strix TaxID=222440 RepID=A0A5J4WYS7_9EUKA|nr:MAG: putative Tau tubulin kinase 1 [Streblomastix strix]